MRFHRIFCTQYAASCCFDGARHRRARTREVDFLVDAGGRLELYEAKWTELPDMGDTVNLDFVRNVVGKSRVVGAAVVARAPNGFPLPNGFRALTVAELG